jgi:hypothetical protein
MSLFTNLVSYWSFNGGNSNDAVGSNNGTDTNVIYQRLGAIIGKCIDLDGTGFINVGNSSSLNPTTGISISAWINTDYPDLLDNWFFARDDDTLGRSYAFGINGSGQIEVQINGLSTITTTTTLPSNIHHVVLTGNSTNGYIVYLDSVSVGTASWVAPGVTTGDTTIGERTYSGFQGLFDGFIDEVGFWSRALTQSEVTALYNNGVGLTYPFIASSQSGLLTIGIGIII